MRAVMPRRRAPILLASLAASIALAACGSEGNDVKDASASVNNGAKLFSERCSGCHTLDVVGAQGSATKVHDRERVDGPNFNVRKECEANVLYAIRNGGYSGAIMPENIAVGQDANDIASFLTKYSGQQAKRAVGSTPIRCTSTP
jgi:mono/diheme cytochrome c family protein